jgi:hypothetical protein
MIRNASKDTNFGKADDKLSRIATTLLMINREENEAWEDMSAWHAPSECWDLIKPALEAARKEIFNQSNMDETEFLAEVAKRTSDRWIYHHFYVR